MTQNFERVFGKTKPVIGMVHIGALPGTPLFDPSFDLLAAARADLVALALAPLTGWSVVTIILVTGVLVTAYTLIGGIEAVIWTDVVQSVVLALGIFLCLGLIFSGMPALDGCSVTPNSSWRRKAISGPSSP